jgi:hypothetical protein
LAAVHALREAYGWLNDVIDAEAGGSNAPRPGGAPLTAQAAARRDALLRAERADRTALTRHGLTDTASSGGTSPMPIRPELLDARAQAHTTTAEMTAILEHAVDAHPAYDHTPDARTAPRDPDAALAWALDALPHVGPWTASAVATAANRADTTLRALLDVPASERPCGIPCPACGGYGLVWETAAPDPSQWTVLCTQRPCPCWGDTCNCGLDPKVPGIPHRWPGETALSWAVTITEGVAA